MTCGSTTGYTEKQLNAGTSAPAIEWFTGWTSCIGLDKIMPVILGRACTSPYFEVQLVQQVALVRTDNPSTPVLKGTLQTPTSGSFSYGPGVLDISADTAGAAYVRWGISYTFTTGQGPASGNVGMEIAYTRCGEMAGAGTWQLTTTTTAVQYLAVTEFLPSLLVDKVKLAGICSSLTGNLQWRLVYRTAATSKASPGAWANVDANTYGAAEVNTGDVALSLSPNMRVQFGIGYFLSSAGSGQATLAAAIGTRRS
jgi:hypothetical protein